MVASVPSRQSAPDWGNTRRRGRLNCHRPLQEAWPTALRGGALEVGLGTPQGVVRRIGLTAAMLPLETLGPYDRVWCQEVLH